MWRSLGDSRRRHRQRHDFTGEFRGSRVGPCVGERVSNTWNLVNAEPVETLSLSRVSPFLPDRLPHRRQDSARPVLLFPVASFAPETVRRTVETAQRGVVRAQGAQRLSLGPLCEAPEGPPGAPVCQVSEKGRATRRESLRCIDFSFFGMVSQNYTGQNAILMGGLGSAGMIAYPKKDPTKLTRQH